MRVELDGGHEGFVRLRLVPEAAAEGVMLGLFARAAEVNGVSHHFGGEPGDSGGTDALVLAANVLPEPAPEEARP